MKVRKSSSDVIELTNFFRLSEMYPDKIMLKKLVKIVEEFLRNHYLKSFGF